MLFDEILGKPQRRDALQLGIRRTECDLSAVGFAGLTLGRDSPPKDDLLSLGAPVPVADAGLFCAAQRHAGDRGSARGALHAGVLPDALCTGGSGGGVGFSADYGVLVVKG